MFRVNCRQVGWPKGSRNGSVRARGSDLSPLNTTSWKHIYAQLWERVRVACIGKQLGTQMGPSQNSPLPTITSSDQGLMREMGINPSTRDRCHPYPLALRALPPRGVASYEDSKWWSERKKGRCIAHGTGCTVRVTCIISRPQHQLRQEWHMKAICNWAFWSTKVFTTLPQGTGEGGRRFPGTQLRGSARPCTVIQSIPAHAQRLVGVHTCTVPGAIGGRGLAGRAKKCSITERVHNGQVYANTTGHSL